MNNERKGLNPREYVPLRCPKDDLNSATRRNPTRFYCDITNFASTDSDDKLKYKADANMQGNNAAQTAIIRAWRPILNRRMIGDDDVAG
jgi:hypothetical protein